MEVDNVTITKSQLVVINGVVKGFFRTLQEEIVKERMDLVQKYKFKAIYIGNAKFRYIADWELIIKEYYGLDFTGSEGQGEEGD